MSALPAEMPSTEAVPADVETVMRRLWPPPGDAAARPPYAPETAIPDLPSWLAPGAQQPPPPAPCGRGVLRPVPGSQGAGRPVRSVQRRSGVITGAEPAPGAASTLPVRLTRRGRVVIAVLAAMVTTGLCVAGASAAQATSGSASPRGAAGGAGLVVVQPGDTLWSIAKSADPGADTRTIVQEMLQLNRLTGPGIAPGQRLWVPRG